MYLDEGVRWTIVVLSAINREQLRINDGTAKTMRAKFYVITGGRCQLFIFMCCGLVMWFTPAPTSHQTAEKKLPQERPLLDNSAITTNFSQSLMFNL